jgi:hypothetical protein
MQAGFHNVEPGSTALHPKSETAKAKHIFGRTVNTETGAVPGSDRSGYDRLATRHSCNGHAAGSDVKII